jgi:tetratricopeptide (TPR) repeat protein
MNISLALLLLISVSQLSQSTSKPNAQTSKSSISSDAMQQAAVAREAEGRQDWRAAEAGYLKALEIQPRWAEVMVNLGVVYNRLGETEKAINIFARAGEIDRRLIAAFLNLGVTYYRGSRYQEAIGPLRHVVRLQPSNLQARQLIALSLIGLEEFHQAAIELEALQKLKKDDPAVLLALGQTYLRLKLFKKAVKPLVQLTRTSSTAKGHLLLGEALDNASEPERAIVELQKALQLDDKLPEVNYSLGFALLKKGDSEAATPYFERELQINPSHLLSRYQIGKIQFTRGDYQRAIENLEKVLNGSPDFRPGLEALGQARLKNGDAVRAIEVLERAVKIDPDWPDGRVLLGRAYMAAGRRADAQKEFEAAQRLSQQERKKLEEAVSGKKPRKTP